MCKHEWWLCRSYLYQYIPEYVGEYEGKQHKLPQLLFLAQLSKPQAPCRFSSKHRAARNRKFHPQKTAGEKKFCTKQVSKLTDSFQVQTLHHRDGMFLVCPQCTFWNRVGFFFKIFENFCPLEVFCNFHCRFPSVLSHLRFTFFGFYPNITCFEMDQSSNYFVIVPISSLMQYAPAPIFWDAVDQIWFSRILWFPQDFQYLFPFPMFRRTKK